MIYVIQPYMFEPLANGNLSEAEDSSEPDDDTRVQQEASEW